MSGRSKKLGIAAKGILQKHMDTVTSILQANPTRFYSKLAAESLVSTDAYDPGDKTMNKGEHTTTLYIQCMTAVETTPSNFFKVLGILSTYPQLDQVVEEMKKEGEL